MLVLPLALAAVFELRWAWLDGPTVDAPRFDSSYGVLMILGRGLFGLLFVPLLLGVAVRAGWVRRRTSGPVEPRLTAQGRRLPAAAGDGRRGRRRRGARLPRRATRDTSRDRRPGWRPAARSITLERVELGGVSQWISMSPHSTDNPVLLYLHGGPGQSGLPFTRFLFAELERDFVVVDWDQHAARASRTRRSAGPRRARSTGSWRAPSSSRTTWRTASARRRSHLAGTSWGSTLGVLAVQREPSSSTRSSEAGRWSASARPISGSIATCSRGRQATGDTGLAGKLRSFGAPPYEDVFACATVMQRYEQLEPEYTFIPAVERIDEERLGRSARGASSAACTTSSRR